MKTSVSCFAILSMLSVSSQALAAAPKVDAELDAILASDLSELTVTSVSKRAQRLSDAPAAIYVITQEELHRAGVTSIPEALRLAPGVEVAQYASNRWSVSARGFNNGLANKLLVMIDGRSVYTPVYSGVYWDDKTTLISDIERIEVIRGPGATVWGANAVNGVINIITKNANDTQGNIISAGVGTEEHQNLQARHGGKIDDDTAYRVWAQEFSRDRTELTTEADNIDDWNRQQSGFRVDGKRGKDSYTVQGDAYHGQEGITSTVFFPGPPFFQRISSDSVSYGGNVLGRYNRVFSEDSEASLQIYGDYYRRNERFADQSISTFDVDFQHSMKLNARNNFVYGLGARLVHSQLDGTYTIDFTEEQRIETTLSAFVQDEYALVPDKLFLTLGSKFEHNDVTGFEFQPTGRLSWRLSDNQTMWGAVSRAVRIPSIYEQDVDATLISVASTLPGITANVARLGGNPNMEAEELLAYEIGYRIRPMERLSFDAAVYYNDYDKLVDIASVGTPYVSGTTAVLLPTFAGNVAEGKIYGGELAVNWTVKDNWRLVGTYDYRSITIDGPSIGTYNPNAAERNSPKHQFSLRSYWTVVPGVQWDNMFYYVDHIRPGNTPIRAYLRYDMRVGWQVTPGLELSLIGRNLLDPDHQEFSATPQTEIERSVLAQASWKF